MTFELQTLHLRLPILNVPVQIRQVFGTVVTHLTTAILATVVSTIKKSVIFSFLDAVAAVGGFNQRDAIENGDAPPRHA